MEQGRLDVRQVTVPHVGMATLPFWLGIVFAVAVLVLEAISLGPAATLATEGRGVELVSAVILFATLAVCLTRIMLSGRLEHWHVALLIAALAMRELDLDKRVFEDGLFRLRFYTGDAASLWQKAVGAAFIVLLLSAVWRFVQRGCRSWMSAVRDRASWAWVLGAGILAAAVAKTIDGAARKLEPLGLTITDTVGAALSITEEFLELCFAFALFWAVCKAPAWSAERQLLRP